MKYGGYRFKDYETGKIQKARSTDLSDLSDEGICFYRPFPQKKLNILDLFRFVEKIIIEDGTYEQLIEAGGSFAELVKRQRVDF